jgi:hypothetical protein
VASPVVTVHCWLPRRSRWSTTTIPAGCRSPSQTQPVNAGQSSTRCPCSLRRASPRRHLFPVPVMIGCTVIAVNSTALGDYPKVTVSTAVDAVAAQGDVDVFTVVADQLREARSC